MNTPTAGTRVTGAYIGVPFSGVVRKARRHTMSHDVEVFFVDFDTPISFNGSARDGACLELDRATLRDRYNSFLSVEA